MITAAASVATFLVCALAYMVGYARGRRGRLPSPPARRARMHLTVEGRLLLDVAVDQLPLLAAYGGGRWSAFERHGVRVRDYIALEGPKLDLVVTLEE